LKTLSQKLIKIEILLSLVKLYKISVLKHLSEQKNFPKKHANKNRKNVSLEGKTDQNRENQKNDLLENRPSVGFRFIENRSVSVSVSVSRKALEHTILECCRTRLYAFTEVEVALERAQIYIWIK
jgi:hypothetical protein